MVAVSPAFPTARLPCVTKGCYLLHGVQKLDFPYW